MGFVLSQCGFEQLKLEKTIGKNIYDHGEAIVKCFRYKKRPDFSGLFSCLQADRIPVLLRLQRLESRKGPALIESKLLLHL